MPWVLLWVTIAGSGSITSGSAEFQSLEACYAAQRAYGSISVDASNAPLAKKHGGNSTETVCINTATGERKTSITPRQG